MNKTIRSRNAFFARIAGILTFLVFIAGLTGCAALTEKRGINIFQKGEASSKAESSENDPEPGAGKITTQKSSRHQESLPEEHLDALNPEIPNVVRLTATDDKIQSRFDKSLEFYQTGMEFWQQGDLENAIEALDNGYALIVATNAGDDPKFIQQKDDLRFMISKRILEIYASRHTTVKGNYNAIPVEINDYVQREIDHFTTGTARQFFINSYKRSGRYRPYIVQELRNAGIPEELSWLPLVESGYIVHAMSHARALGMWQFIASTGYKFGLKRDPYIDERLDPYKSTHGAIAYLTELHGIFGDWKTVLAAYNCGEGRVLREIRRQNINYLDDFWDLYQRLPRETAQYVPRFLATLHIVNNLEKYGMGDIEPDQPFAYETLRVSSQATLKSIAEALDIAESDLTILNPELRYKRLPPEEYPLRVPAGKKELLLAKIDEIPEYQKAPERVVQHRVRRGETLSAIALRYGTTVREIARFNNIYRESYIVAGQVLRIPQAGEVAAMRSRPAAERFIDYTVKRGDSLWLLANRHNTTTRRIQEINNLGTVNLHIGQQLRIPAQASTVLKTYTVKRGDSPFSIARQHNMSLSDLLSINQLTPNCRIYPDQQLHVR